ncbi:MAG: non-heme iron oxygenase ferredoxin subunit [Anaerolineae bacterium]|nr:non-heme iron oxygenase ferredoxin subunit [Anaerolineae bacterium]
MAEWLTLIDAGEIGPGDREVFDVNGYYVALFNVDGTYYAIEDACTHDDGPLAEGELHGHEIECPRHGACFDLRTGEALNPPAVTPAHRFEVRVQDGAVQILFDLEG